MFWHNGPQPGWKILYLATTCFSDWSTSLSIPLPLSFFFPPPNNVRWLSILEGAPEINSQSWWRTLRIVLSFQDLRFNSFHKHHWKSSAGSKWTTIQLLVHTYPTEWYCLVFWTSLIILLHLPVQSLYIYCTCCERCKYTHTHFTQDACAHRPEQELIMCTHTQLIIYHLHPW